MKSKMMNYQELTFHVLEFIKQEENILVSLMVKFKYSAIANKQKDNKTFRTDI